MADIFISYSSKDRESALDLVERLRAGGNDVWIDGAELSGALNWSSEIVQAINDCTTFIFLISSNSATSHNCAKEVLLASEKQKNILPIVLEETSLPVIFEYALAGLQRVRFDASEQIDAAVKKLRSGRSALEAMTTWSASIAPDDGKIRLAVLPFDDLSALHDNEWFADGMMDDLIDTLGALEKLRVNPRNDVIYYKGKQPRLDEIAGDLHVQYIVSGSVQKAGEKIRIRVSLSDTKMHEQVWSGKYDGTFDDVFDLQDRTARAITQALKIKLTTKDEHAIDARETDSPAAYELFLRAKDHFFTMHTRAGLERALELYEEVIRIDPNFAAAHAEIMNVCTSLYRNYLRSAEILARAAEAGEKIRSIEGESARWHWMMSHFKLWQGKAAEALTHAEQAVATGYPLGYEALGFAHKALGNLFESVRARETFIMFRENETTAHFNLIISLNELGDTTRLREAALRAIPVFERHLRLFPEDYHLAVHFANVLAFAGQEDKALAKGKELLYMDSPDGLSSYNLACLFLHLGDTVHGLEAVCRSIQKGFRNIDVLRRDPDLAPLRGVPKFEALITELEETLVKG
jgi:TolB-like protein